MIREPAGIRQGGCLRSALAYVLGLGEGEVPDFEADPTPYSWYEAVRAFLASHGRQWHIHAPWPRPGLYVAYGWSPRGPWKHVVVMRDGAVEYDYEGGAGVLTETLEVWTFDPIEPSTRLDTSAGGRDTEIVVHTRCLLPQIG